MKIVFKDSFLYRLVSQIEFVQDIKRIAKRIIKFNPGSVMKPQEEFLQNTNKSVFDIPAKYKYIVPIFFLVVIFSTTSCKSDDEIYPNLVYGISFPKYSVSEPDSIVQIDLTTGKYKNLSTAKEFEGLNSTKYIAYSRKQNVIVYDIHRSKVGFIYLDNGTNETMDFNNDSTFEGIKSLQIIEGKDLLIVLIGRFNYSDNTKALEVVEVNIKTKNIISRLQFVDFDNTLNVFADVDEANSRIFLVPDNSSNPLDKLYIYNYAIKELTSQPINTSFLDVHYSSGNQCLVGSSYAKEGIGLFSYSLNNQKTDTIGIYSGINAILPKMNYFDKKTNLYWLGIVADQGPNYLKLTNISLSNASFSKSFPMPKVINIIN